MRTVDYLNAVQSRYGLTSDYQLAHKLGLTRGGVSSLRLGRTVINDDTAEFLAQLLELPPARVIAHANAERAERANKPSMLQMWLGVAAKYGATAAGVALVGIGLAGNPTPSSAATFLSNSDTHNINSQPRMFGFRRLIGLLLPTIL